MRYAIRRSALLRPLAFAFGGTKGQSFVDVEDGALRLRFGPLFDETLPLDAIDGVEAADWPLLGGLGWRTNFVDTLGLVGSYDGVVRIRLKERVPVRMLLPLKVDRVYVSLEDPTGFVAELRSRLEMVGEQDRRAARPEAHA